MTLNPPVMQPKSPKIPTHWITPEEQLRILSAPFLPQIKQVLPLPLANIVADYALYHLSLNATLWYIALKKLPDSPEKIPPLPLNMIQIFHIDCPIQRNELNPDKTHKTIEDTHFLGLIPKGSVDKLACQIFGTKHKRPYLSDFHYGPGLQHPDITDFNEPEWVMISPLLPKSENKTYAQQMKMIKKLKKTTGINYEPPTFKHTLALNLLYAAAVEKGLWEKSLATRVQETFHWKTRNLKEWWNSPDSSTERNLTIGDPYSQYNAEIGINQTPVSHRSHFERIAVLWKISKPTPQAARLRSELKAPG